MKNLGNYCPEQLLFDGFKTVFGSVAEGGFYDSLSGVYPVLEYVQDNTTIIYQPSNNRYWRYNSFLMMGVLYARFFAPYDWMKLFDDRIQAQLKIFITKLEKKNIKSLCSYSIGPLMTAFAFAFKIYGDNKYVDAIDLLIDNSRFEIKSNEDSFLLLGLSRIYEYIPDHRMKVLEIIKALTKVILEHQNERGLFIFEGITSKRHQNQMYTLWALISSFEILGISNTGPLKENVEYTIKNRFENDGGILWEDNVPLYIRAYHLLKGIRYWEYYFECHQCFFAHAIFGYSRISHDGTYICYAEKALNWIFGRNRFNVDLLSVSELNVPHRIIDVNGCVHVYGQYFKGTYEIGGYLMGITDYILENGR